MNKNKKDITQYDIAKALNISQATVARVINNESNVKEETRKLVLDKIEELNYVPNFMASRLAKFSNTNINLKIILPKYPENFWESMINGVNACFNEVGNIGINYEVVQLEQYQDNDLLNYLDRINDEELVNFLIIYPINNDNFINALKEVDKNTSIIFINDVIKDFNYMYYVGPDNIASGKIAGEFMGKFLNRDGNVYVIASYESQSETKDRISGFSEVIKNDFGNIILNYFFYDITKESAYEFAKKILIRNSDIDGIYNTDGFINDIGTALNELKRKETILVGHEYYSDSKKLMDDNIIDVAISQNPFDQGYYSIKILYNYLTKKLKKRNQNYYINFEIIMKNNQKKNKIMDMLR